MLRVTTLVHSCLTTETSTSTKKYSYAVMGVPSVAFRMVGTQLQDWFSNPPIKPRTKQLLSDIFLLLTISFHSLFHFFDDNTNNVNCQVSAFTQYFTLHSILLHVFRSFFLRNTAVLHECQNNIISFQIQFLISPYCTYQLSNLLAFC